MSFRVIKFKEDINIKDWYEKGDAYMKLGYVLTNVKAVHPGNILKCEFTISIRARNTPYIQMLAKIRGMNEELLIINADDKPLPYVYYRYKHGEGYKYGVKSK